MNVGMMRQIENFQTRNGALDSDERALVRRHPAESANLLRWAGVTDEEWLACVLQHHENDDGSGYPEGRIGAEIGQNAKLIGMADRYCACVSARNYRRSMLPPLALAKLCSEGAAACGPELVEQLASQLGPCPPGALVRLANGAIAVVARRAAGALPLSVHLLLSADGKPAPPADAQRAAVAECAIAEALHEDEAGVRFSMQAVWGELASL
jgi:HD-GYP domain-containing protein (c-di-GMP phosphodiesterase class II)